MLVYQRVDAKKTWISSELWTSSNSKSWITRARQDVLSAPNPLLVVNGKAHVFAGSTAFVLVHEIRQKCIIVGKPRQIPHPCSWNPHSCFGKLRIFCGKHQSFSWSNNHLWCLNHSQQFDPWAGESQPRAREADGRQDRQGSLLIWCLLAFAMFDSLRVTHWRVIVCC